MLNKQLKLEKRAMMELGGPYRLREASSSAETNFLHTGHDRQLYGQMRTRACETRGYRIGVALQPGPGRVARVARGRASLVADCHSGCGSLGAGRRRLCDPPRPCQPCSALGSNQLLWLRGLLLGPKPASVPVPE